MSLKDWIRYVSARTISRLPDGMKIRISGLPPIVVDGQQLDPQMQVLVAMRRKMGERLLLAPTIDAARERYRFETRTYRGPMTKVATVRDFDIGSVRVRHYTTAAKDAPLTVYMHGGGFVIGDLDTHDEPCRMLCRWGGTNVLSVDYRLAPEHPFPAALEDVARVLAWAHDHATRVGIGGDSAGANLATVVARLTSHKPAAQLLIYPPADGTCARPSHTLFDEGYFLSRADRKAFAKAYRAPEHDPRASPLLAEDLSGLPPALLITAGFDILRDEGEAYGDALRAAGVPLRSHRYPGLGHGFIHLTGISQTSRAAMREIAVLWREVLAGTHQS
jgi:acetyl esterase